MKKICICTTVSITLKSFVVPTAKYLHDTYGYEVTLICDPDEAFAASLPEGIRYLPVRMSRGIDFSGLRSVMDFIKIFKREKFDLVQYSTPNAACYASIAAKLCRVPIRLYCQWGIRYVGLSGTGRTIFKTIEKLVCKLSTDIRAVSRLNRQFAVSEGLYPETKAEVVGNGGTIGVDLSDYDREMKQAWNTQIAEQYGIGCEDFVFGFAGRVSVDKGCAELLQAFQSIAEEYKNAKLLIVGPFEKDCGLEEELVAWANASEQVILTGKVENRDMKRYYSAMDVLVHPTYREGFGMVIQEAGALAVPVITTKIPGASEVMEDGVSALHVEPKNTDDLRAAMARMLDAPECAKTLGENAYQRTKALYDREIMLGHQGKDYGKLLGVAELQPAAVS